MTTRWQKRMCKVCKKEITVELNRMGYKQWVGKIGTRKRIITSVEGVYFDEGKVWFCNGCWEEVRK